MRHLIKIFSITSVILFSFFTVVANETVSNSTENHTPPKHEESFNAGKMIIEHIADAHEWHVATIGHSHITVPLPIILWDNGLVVFSSANFHHGHDAYKGYRLMHDGKYKGKIVKVKEDGITIAETNPVPLDFSITKNVFSLFVGCLVIIIVVLSVAKAYKKRSGMAPKGLQAFIEPLIMFIIDDVAKPSIGKDKYLKFLPFLLSIFFFIFFNNLLGIVPFFPGGANLTGNISVTLVLALFTFTITTISGTKTYWIHIFNTPGVPWWLKAPLPLMPVIELIGVITKPFVLMVRLFANITAGHIISLSFISLIFIFGAIHVGIGYGVSIMSVGLYIFISLLEILVAFLQAYVFTLLSAIYIGMATESHHGHEENHAHDKH